MTPALGNLVHYCLSVTDALNVNQRRRQDGTEATGNIVKDGDLFPMMVTRVWGKQPESCVNGQVFLDGNDTLWVTSVRVGDGRGTFRWPHEF